MTAHNLPYVHWLLSPLSKSPVMQFLCTVKAHLLSHKQKPTTKKERKKERKHGSSIDASPCFFVLQHKPVQSYPYYWMGRGGSESQGVGQGGVGFLPGIHPGRVENASQAMALTLLQCTSHGQTVRRSLVGCCSLRLLHIHCC